jgi:hypothetical protein
MKRFAIFLAVIVGVVLAVGTAYAAQPASSGPHFNLNIIGFENCTMDPETPGVYPDCFKGQDGPGGHVIFVPWKTAQVEDICATEDPIVEDPTDVTVAELQRGVRILVTDAFGDDLQVIDKDATDGLAKFNLPDGCYQVFASPGGKPDGCMDIDTIICFECEIVDEVEVCTQVNCAGDLSNDKFVLVGHINVDRSKGKPHWDNVTDDLLPAITGVGSGDPGYLDFFWQIYNQYLRVAHLRIQSIPCE